jgi:hypothetical protein
VRKIKTWLMKNVKNPDIESGKGGEEVKRIMILATLVVALGLGLSGIVQAKQYRPLSILSKEYTAEIPDNVILPDTSQLELAVAPRHYPQNQDITMFLYRDPKFKYFEEISAEEIFPYVEVVKEERGIKHLITLAFINQELKTEVYKDKSAFSGSTSDRLEEITVKQKSIRRIPR